MSLKIRLARGGAKKRPYYQIVVSDARSPRDGRFIERVGSYNPMVDKDHPERLTLKTERIQHWLSFGAQPTDRRRALPRRCRADREAGAPRDAEAVGAGDEGHRARQGARGQGRRRGARGGIVAREPAAGCHHDRCNAPLAEAPVRRRRRRSPRDPRRRAHQELHGRPGGCRGLWPRRRRGGGANLGHQGDGAAEGHRAGEARRHHDA